MRLLREGEIQSQKRRNGYALEVGFMTFNKAQALRVHCIRWLTATLYWDHFRVNFALLHIILVCYQHSDIVISSLFYFERKRRFRKLNPVRKWESQHLDPGHLPGISESGISLY